MDVFREWLTSLRESGTLTRRKMSRLGGGQRGVGGGARFPAGLSQGLTATMRRVRSLFARSWPERQVIVRTGGAVRYIRVPGLVQLGLVAVLAATLGWIGYLTFYYVSFDWMLERQNRQTAAARIAYGEALAEVERYRGRIAAVMRDMEARRRALAALLQETGVARATAVAAVTKLGPRVRQTSAGEADASPGYLTHLKGNWQALVHRTDGLETGLSRIETKLRKVVGVYGAVRTERDGLRGKVSRLERSLASLSTRQRDLLRIASAQDAVLAERDGLRQRVVRLSGTVASLRASQEKVLKRVSRSTTDTVVEVEKLVAMTGLDVDRMLAALERQDRRTRRYLPHGQGGPFLSLAATKLPPDDPLVKKVAALDVKMGRWNNLQRLLRMLPLAPPIDQYRMTSGFGRRLDPMRRRWSFHAGVDLANRMGTPVLSTAPGKVVFAGWRGGFGRMVEIDHGLGLRTRYGHLKKILVRVGQRVSFRQKIALLGSSGRSTGPHVHYEVRLNGRSVDPARFMRAGKYVFRSP